jgi:DNA-binding transcriptional ArsR family regulator
MSRKDRTDKHEELAAALAALGHATRLHIALALRDGESSPRTVAEQLDGQSLSAVSHHFRALSRADVIRETRTRQVRGAVEHFYVLTPTAIELLFRLGLYGSAGSRDRR